MRGLWVGAELAVTFGVVLLLLVAHQLWWTNQQARADAQDRVSALEREWEQSPPASPGESAPGDGADDSDSAGDPTVAPDRDSGAEDAGPSRSREPAGPSWDLAYAVLDVPRLGLRVPVAEGTAKKGVLNEGYVGHYAHTAQPGRAGNFALAGHRNTHGEPFRYINRLRSGDALRVETKSATYTYVVDKTLAQTLPRDGGVIEDIPRSDVRTSQGYDKPGYYITLTTCTPEYTSKYRLIVWGKLKSMNPR